MWGNIQLWYVSIVKDQRQQDMQRVQRERKTFQHLKQTKKLLKTDLRRNSGEPEGGSNAT